MFTCVWFRARRPPGPVIAGRQVPGSNEKNVGLRYRAGWILECVLVSPRMSQAIRPPANSRFVTFNTILLIPSTCSSTDDESSNVRTVLAQLLYNRCLPAICYFIVFFTPSIIYVSSYIVAFFFFSLHGVLECRQQMFKLGLSVNVSHFLVSINPQPYTGCPFASYFISRIKGFWTKASYF